MDEYQIGWLDALERVLELSHLSKQEILDYCKEKSQEINDDRNS